MRDQFLKAVLPTQGWYSGFAESTGDGIDFNNFKSLDELIEFIDKNSGVIESDSYDGGENHYNVFFAVNTFKDYSTRSSENALWGRSFFVDLDVGPEKPYKTKAEALDSITEFTRIQGLPPALIIDSGRGIHGYWPFDIDIPIDEWRHYAQLFKQFCKNSGLNIDPAITADAARIMRCPDTLNQKTDPPSPCYVVSSEIYQYSFAEFKEFLDAQHIVLNDAPEREPIPELEGVELGVDEESRSVLTSSFETLFTDIVLKSLGQVPNEVGCAQIAHIITNSKTIDYNLWFAGLSVAARCDDARDAIHSMSEDYDGYSPQNTEFKAAETLKATGPRTCAGFDELNPGVCTTCPHWGKITTPIELGRKLKATPNVQKAPGNQLAVLINRTPTSICPKDIYPFFIPNEGGVWMYLPSDGTEEDGAPPPAIQILPFNLYPLHYALNQTHGNCLIMAYETPHNGRVEYTFYSKYFYSPDRFAEFVMSHGVVPERNNLKFLMDYHAKWFLYMLSAKTIELMHMQMGFTDDAFGFVLGDTEYRANGVDKNAVASPYVKGVAKMLVAEGEYARWRMAADYLNAPSMEIHAFAMMCAFGSPLMQFTSTKGVCVSLYGPKGVAKTGAMFGCLSVYGNPHSIMITKATDNAATQRLLTLHNLPFGRDEISNMDPLHLSNLIHDISSGKPKVRLQSTADAERALERAASIIALFTSNHAAEAKLELIKANPEGEMARLVEFFIDDKPALFAHDPALSERIFDTFRECFGHAGPMYVKYLFKLGIDNVKERIRKWVDRFRMSFGGDSAYRFYENLVATTFAGAEMANEADIIKFDLERIFGIVMTHICSIRDNVPLNNYDYSSVVGDYIHKNAQNALIIDGGRVVSEPRGELKIRIDVVQGTQTISKSDFKKYLSTMQISPREFEIKVKQMKLLTDVNKKRLGAGWHDGAKIPAIHCYEFTTPVDVDSVISEMTPTPALKLVPVTAK